MHKRESRGYLESYFSSSVVGQGPTSRSTPVPGNSLSEAISRTCPHTSLFNQSLRPLGTLLQLYLCSSRATRSHVPGIHAVYVRRSKRRSTRRVPGPLRAIFQAGPPPYPKLSLPTSPITCLGFPQRICGSVTSAAARAPCSVLIPQPSHCLVRVVRNLKGALKGAARLKGEQHTSCLDMAVVSGARLSRPGRLSSHTGSDDTVSNNLFARQPQVGRLAAQKGTVKCCSLKK